MRWLMVSVALMTVTGCTPDAVSLEHRAEVETRSRGLALLDDESAAQVGMVGNTCEVDTLSGGISTDNDVAPGEEDNVVDAVGAATLVVGSAGIYYVDRGVYGGFDPEVEIDNALDAGITNDGIVALSGTDSDCTVSWFEGGGDAASANIEGCSGEAFAVDRDGGRAFVPSVQGLVVANPDGSTATIGGAADLVAWDPAQEIVFGATRGASTLSAFTADGVAQWQADLGGRIMAIDDMETVGAVAVMMEVEGGMGELLVLDSTTGEPLTSVPTPSAAQQVLVGNFGRSMALVLPNEVHFFAVDLAAE